MVHTYQNFLLSGKNRDNVYIRSTYNELCGMKKTFHPNDFKEIAEPKEKHFDDLSEDQYLLHHKMRKL